MYELKLNELKEKTKDFNRILLQLPEGLKPKAYEIANSLDCEVIVSGEPCWGACDLALNEAKELKVDAIVIFGHTPLVKTDIPVVYMETPYLKPIPKTLAKKLNAKLKNYNKIGIAASIQHIHQIKKLKLEKQMLVTPQSGKNVYKGQVLGCDCSGIKQIQNDVDAIVVIGTKFHASGVALSTKKPVILLDLYNETVTEMNEEKEQILKRRYAQIEKSKTAKKFGILISLKPGQKELGLAKQVQQKLNNPIIISMNEITPEKLIQFYDIDCFISLACPRIVIEESVRFAKPILNYKELLVLLKELQWNNILESGWY